MLRRIVVVFILVAISSFVSPCFAQQGQGNECTIAGNWIGGSVVAYQMTIIPINPSGHYMVLTQPGFTEGTLATMFTQTVVKHGDVYEGGGVQLYSENPAFASGPPTLFLMPDVHVLWSSMKLTDCNTLTTSIPFFGLYFADGIFSGTTVPFVTPLDVDLVNVLNGGMPITESYRRLPTTKPAPELMH